MKLYLLDMGQEKCGDCIVCLSDDGMILIDGGHSNDINQRGGAPSIPDQLASILGPRPFSPDLLIVTHCHADHIGCLPLMVSEGMLTPKAALVADPDLGFAGTDRDCDEASHRAVRLAAALREVPHDDAASDEELAAFIEDASTLEPRYRGMLAMLRMNGTYVVPYQKPQDGAEFERSLARMRLRILGPTAEHLQICSNAITDSVAHVRSCMGARSSGADDSEVDLYRLLRATGISAQGMPSNGAALNNQSIIVAVSNGGHSALLTGDMQFATPENPSLDKEMQALRKTVADMGPYAMVKLPDHGSYKGTDQNILRDFGARVLTISGGRNDPDHPDSRTLDMLAAQNDFTWARTDRNGMITCILDRNGATLAAKGRFNDATHNVHQTLQPDDPVTVSGLSNIAAASHVSKQAALEVVEVTARLPHVATRVTMTIDVAPNLYTQADPGSRLPTPDLSTSPGVTVKPSNPPKPAQRRVLHAPSISDPAAYKMRETKEKLLFVTATRKLSENVGSAEARLALSAIAEADHGLLELTAPNNPYPEVARALGSRTFDGVVLLGGYDVVPSARMDVLDATLRRSMAIGDVNSDPDHFIVWSDQLYGDTDHDQLAELPVSRIPDGHSASILRAALAKRAASQASAFGLRNVNRPFAQTVFAGVPGRRADPICSRPQVANRFSPPKVTGSSFYFMLHGSYNDLSRFWGEDENSYAIEAFNLNNVPDAAGGTVLAGCCWGALTIFNRAVSFAPGDTIQAVTADQSIALRFLQSGINAYIGCTGSHYSPFGEAPDSAGGPMHVAFWQQITAGLPPARALFEAKKQYAAGIPHLDNSAAALAIDAKTLRQFTCLGLGW